MLKNHHYSKWAFAKLIFVLPLIAFLLMLNCKQKQAVPETSETIDYNLHFENMEEGVYEVDIKQNEDKSQDITVKKKEPEAKPNADGVHRFVEIMPEPIGGMDAMYKFLQDNLTYPAEAKEKGIQGQVFLEFVVEKNGSIGNVKVIRGVNPLLDAEAVRAVSLLPDWKPGMQNGKPVRCFYQIPIRFAIDKDKK
jgi:protein TonB